MYDNFFLFLELDVAQVLVLSFSLRHMWFRLNVTLTQTFHTWSNSVGEFLFGTEVSSETLEAYFLFS